MAHVYKDNNGALYTVILNLVDVLSGGNSYYKLQLLEHDANKKCGKHFLQVIWAIFPDSGYTEPGGVSGRRSGIASWRTWTSRMRKTSSNGIL